MTEETCANCGLNRFWCSKAKSCKKFKPQNHAEKSLSEKKMLRIGMPVYSEKNVKEAVKRLKNGIEQMKRNVVKDNCKDEEVDFWMNKMETPVIKLIDKIMGDDLI